jgi:hypothetical protein
MVRSRREVSRSPPWPRPFSSEARLSKFSRVRTFGIVSNKVGKLEDTALTLVDVHIDDLSDAFILLVEEAVKPKGGNAQWGDDGYYFAEAGEFVCPSPNNQHVTRRN